MLSTSSCLSRPAAGGRQIAVRSAVAVAAILLICPPLQAKREAELNSAIPGEAWAARDKSAGAKRRSDRFERGTWKDPAKRREAQAKAAGDCAWSPDYAFGGLDGPVLAQTTFDDGSGEALFVGGDFLTAGGIPVFGIAKWDGTAWSALGLGMDDVVFALATFDDGSGEALYAGGFFSSAGGVPAAGIARWDGTSWSAVGGGVETDGAVFALEVFDDGSGEALFAGGLFATAGGNPADNVAKWDGTTWSDLDGGVSDEVDSFAVHDDGSGEALFVGGFFGSAGSGPVATSFVARWDGMAWSAVGLGTSDGVVALEVFDPGGGALLYAGGFFADADGSPVFGIAEWDGSEWTDLDGGMDAPVLALAVHDDGGGPALYAGGFFSFAGSGPVSSPGVARWDGSDWSAVGLGIDVFFGEVDSLGTFDDGGGAHLFAGGFFFRAGGNGAPFLAEWDGTDWLAVLASGPGFLGMEFTVYAFEVFDDGSGPALYAGGEFLLAGGVSASAIARWDGAAWSPLGGGLGCESFFEIPLATTPGRDPTKGIVFEGCEFPSVQALAVYDDGGGPALYAGGIFDLADGLPVANLAKWDGATWSDVGGGTDDVVEALEVFGGELYAGGEFSDAGGTLVSNVARWNGMAWSDVGGGTDDDVETLVVYDDGGGPDLYAGGEFDFAGGVPASRVARWDGMAWSALGLGADDEVETLYVYDDGGGPDLYAGGQFDSAGGVPGTASLARWDGSAWSSVGGGMATFEEFRTVDALVAFDDGTGPALYAGGFFELAGGVPASNVAKWNGAVWSPLDGGTDEEIEALAVFNAPGPSLFAGGFFSFADVHPSSFIGEWRCEAAELEVDDVTLAEGDVGTTAFDFTVSRSHNATDVMVDVASSDATAFAGVDYTALPLATLVLPAGGPLSLTVTVQVSTDTLEEPPAKVFHLDLSSPVGAVIADGQGDGTILDDDDAGAPAVSNVDSTAGTGDGQLAECEEARVAISELAVTFDQSMRDPPGDGGAADVTNPGNYRLFGAGADRRLESSACGAAAGDDEVIAIAGVAYDDPSHTATLDLASTLTDGPYRLVVCGTLADLAGNPLAGGDFRRTFRVERENLFANGHFDCDLAGWNPTSTAPAEIAWASDDVDAATHSGSAAITNLTASTTFALDQCVAVTAGIAHRLSGAVQVSAAPGVSVFLSRVCALHGGAACGGAPLSTVVDAVQLDSSGGVWEPFASTFTPPAGAVSARCKLQVGAPGGVAFGARLDDLSLVLLDAIFSDGFESGDTTAWSLTLF